MSYESDPLAEQLWMASHDGKSGEVLVLLQKGVDPNDDDCYKRKHIGLTPLHVSCANNHPLSTRNLIKWGARLTVVNEMKDTPLHRACFSGSMDCVRLLLEYGSPVDIKNSCGETPLDIAGEWGYNGILEFITQFKSLYRGELHEIIKVCMANNYET